MDVLPSPFHWIVGNPFRESAVFVFPQMKLSGVEIDLLFARLSSMTEAAMVTVTKTVETLDLGLKQWNQ